MNLQREPVLKWSALTGAIVAFFTLLVTLGYVNLSPEQIGSIEAFLVALGALVVPILVAFIPRARVTPVADPRDDLGRPLVPGIDED